MDWKSPVTVLVDTREQVPWVFSPACTIRRVTLAEGDYSAVGLDALARIERKSLADLTGSITHGRDRFMREMERLTKYAYRALIVEASMEDVTAQCYRSRVQPAAVVGTLVKLDTDFGIHVWMAGDASTGARVAESMIRRLLSPSGERVTGVL